MSPLFTPTADPGDLVSARRDIPISMTDHLTGTAGIRQGNRGLVRSRTGSRLTVAFDTGTGITETTVHARDCRLLRRQADEQRFLDYARFKASIRAGAMIALTAPFLWYTALYWWTAGTLDGLIEAMTLSALESALELPALILAHPAQTLIWLAAGTLATRIALGPRPQRKGPKKP